MRNNLFLLTTVYTLLHAAPETRFPHQAKYCGSAVNISLLSWPSDRLCTFHPSLLPLLPRGTSPYSPRQTRDHNTSRDYTPSLPYLQNCFTMLTPLAFRKMNTSHQQLSSPYLPRTTTSSHSYQIFVPLAPRITFSLCCNT